MGFLGFILIAILAICVVVMVRKLKRNNEPGGYTAAPTPPYASTYGSTPAVPYAPAYGATPAVPYASASNPTPVVPVAKPAVTPTPAKTAHAPTSQHTIYIYSAKQATRLCPHCDGENNASATFCIICGQHLY